jgi:hypothetical protein
MSDIAGKANYAFSALKKRLCGGYGACPSCGHENFFKFSGREFHKIPTSLRFCKNCKFFYRYPTTLKDESLAFYEREYVQTGLTTDLPDEVSLEALVAKNFSDTEKDFSIWIPLFKMISQQLDRKIRIIDYGANWGYTAYQLRKCDFVSDCIAYEVSGVRKSYGKQKLNIDYVEEEEFSNSFDVLFSSHALEHMYNPMIIRDHTNALLKPGGYAILTCPNCSLSAVPNHKKWRQSWGQVHPNGITDGFLLNIFSDYNGAVGNEILDDKMFLELLAGCETKLSSFLPTTPNLLAVMKKPA